jgi:ABC-type lipoprotein release transport system permease subunit
VLTYVVSQRRAEIGVRLALGADPGHVLRLVLGSGLRLSLVGTLLGSLAALALVRLLGGLLHEVHPRDPLTFAAVPVLLLAVGVLASLVPAWRATRVDPATTLRAE